MEHSLSVQIVIYSQVRNRIHYTVRCGLGVGPQLVTAEWYLAGRSVSVGSQALCSSAVHGESTMGRGVRDAFILQSHATQISVQQ